MGHTVYVTDPSVTPYPTACLCQGTPLDKIQKKTGMVSGPGVVLQAEGSFLHSEETFIFIYILGTKVSLSGLPAGT